MKTEKLNLGSIKNVLSRAELKKIMAGSGSCIPMGQSNCLVPGSTCCAGTECYTPTGTCTSGF